MLRTSFVFAVPANRFLIVGRFAGYMVIGLLLRLAFVGGGRAAAD